MSTFDVRDIMKASGNGRPGEGGVPSSALDGGKLSPLAEHIATLPFQRSISPIMVEGLVRLFDMGAVALIGALVFAIYVFPVVDFTQPYAIAIPAVSVGTVAIFQALHLYHVGAMRSFAPQSLRLLVGWTAIFLITLAAFFFLKVAESVSRIWLASWYVGGLIVLFSSRIGLSFVLRALTRNGRLERRTAVVGGGEAGISLIKALEAQHEAGVRIVGVFDDRNDDRSPDTVGGYPKLGTVDDLVEFARRTHLDLVIFTLPISAEQRLLHMLRKLWVLPIDIRLSAHMSKLRFRPHSYSYIGAVPVLDVFDKPIADWDMVVKMVFDRVVGALALVFLFPLMLVTAIAVKLDSKGPAFFRQKRYGFNNEMIEVFKFRSMYTDMSDATASRLVTKDDPRVTRVGRFIRKTSIDELPQLFNVVFSGNLSLVGPRPHAAHAKAEERLYDQVVDGYFARHKVKPGITGWAQINGWRGETDTEEKIQRRVEHDLYYIENWSVLFDAYILLMTPISLLKTENAY
ncbi:MAG: undecaprenyl-phosphate glucose phosphotransferase [Hyphomicrobiales bacterium]|jgi:Undecaprenyl-phosphate glucose phosphotransferase|nr:undecaprenyl-phosphate glucose phosphotransferase [Hyphomicrobiales bacterium]